MRKQDHKKRSLPLVSVQKKVWMTPITMIVWSVIYSQTSRSVKSRGRITMNKAGGGDGILAELFKILKDDALKVLYLICQQIWKTQQWPQDWKSQFSFKFQRK